MKAKTELKVLGARGLLPVEAAEREWVEDLQAPVEDIPISICNVDSEGNVIYVSKGFEESFGYPREEVLGKTGFELGIFPDQDLKHLAERTEARLKEKPSRRLEVQLKRKDGKGIWVEMEARVIKKSDVPVAFRLMSKDITDRKQAEETLRELNVKYQQIIDNTWDTIFHIDLEGNFKFANKAVERLTGYPIEELLRMNMCELIVPEYQSFVFGRLKKRIAGQPLPQPFDFEIVHKDAHRVVVELTTTGIHDRNGKLIGVQGIARDVTERKRADESLKESEERYRGLFENSTEGVFAVDLAGNYTSVNKAMEELTGYSREELIGRSYRDSVSPQTAEFVFGEYKKLFRTGEPVHNIVYERISKDGKRGWLEGYANVIKKEGKVVGFQGTLRDITERKKAEQALRESGEKLRAQYKGIPVPTYTWQRIGEDLVLVDYNDAATATTQGHVASSVGKKDSEMYQNRPDILEDLSRCFAEKTSIYREMLYEYMSTGETKHLAVSYAFVPPDLVLVHTEDITEHKRAEEEIRKVTQYLKSVIENANVLLDVMDPEGNVLVWNKAAEVITGYSREEVVGHNKVWKWLYPDREYRRAITAKAATVFGGEVVEDVEVTIRTKRGEDRTLSWYSRNLLDEKGNPIGAVWLGTDITERKRLEQSLKESEERYRMLFENSIEAVFTVDIAGHFTSGNEALEELTGYPLEELIGASYKKIIVAEDVDHIFEEYNKLFGTGEPIHNLVYEMVRKDGGRRLIEGYVNLITEGTRVVGFQGTLRDITQRKKAEEQLEHSFIDLAETVSRAMGSRDPYTAVHQRRVAELARLVGEKMGLDKDRLQGLYIGGLLHDIGKISAPETILTKSGKLTDEEWSLIRVHTKRGHEILQGTNLPWPVAEMALHHHERLDGSGYPCRISGDELSLEVRILGVCNVVEAMSSHRPYRPARSSAEVWEELVSGRGTKYDASIVDIMFQIIESGELGSLLSPPE